MANTKSAAKRARQTKKRTVHGRSIKTAVRSAQKKAVAAVKSADKAAAAAAVSAFSSELDRASKRGVIHKNSADRKKSGFAKALAGLK